MDGDELKEFEKVWRDLNGEYKRSLKGRSVGFRDLFRADGYSIVNARTTEIRGTYFYKDAQDLADGDIVKCKLEPENKHDADAIKVVCFGGETVGHLAKGSKARDDARKALEGGAEVYGIVTDSTMGANEYAEDDDDRVYEKALILLVKTDPGAVYKQPEPESEHTEHDRPDANESVRIEHDIPAPHEPNSRHNIAILVVAVIVVGVLLGLLFTRCS